MHKGTVLAEDMVCGGVSYATATYKGKTYTCIMLVDSNVTLKEQEEWSDSDLEDVMIQVLHNRMSKEEFIQYRDWFYSPMNVASAATTSALESGEAEILTDDSVSGEEFVIEDYTAPGEDLLSDGE